jgi:hypothetical protein
MDPKGCWIGPALSFTESTPPKRKIGKGEENQVDNTENGERVKSDSRRRWWANKVRTIRNQDPSENWTSTSDLKVGNPSCKN